jgi:hypothetical protein
MCFTQNNQFFKDINIEIREIDGDMKTLVYENYNKFISATDTIRKVNSFFFFFFFFAD